MSSLPAKRPLAITVGEPAGIGPELVARLCQQAFPFPLVYVGDVDLLRAYVTDLVILPFQAGQTLPDHQPKRLPCLSIPLATAVIPGQLNVLNSCWVLTCLETAVKNTLQDSFSAVVTGPVHKAIINEAGYPFSGQTEFIAATCNSQSDPIMMLCYEKLRVALVTTHLPLSAVPNMITAARLQHCIQTVHHDLNTRFRCRAPKIAVLGLNPHAGEQGYLGREEIEIITPVLQELQKAGINVSGPYPADTIFTPTHRDSFDAIIAMYHDQGLAALKALGFHATVNVTLGLPIIRTSVDHGTALDLVGKNCAEVGSFNAAIQLAANLAQLT